MRFSCKKCKAQYNIADERVRGKVLKIRCKHCGQALIVRGESGPPEPSPATADKQEDEWHYGLDGKEMGPVTLAKLREMITSGEVSEEAFVWREGLDDWLPVEDVPDLRGHLPSVRAEEAKKAEEKRAEEKRAEERAHKARQNKMVARKGVEDDEARKKVLAKVMEKRAAVRADRHTGRIAEHFFEDGENLSDVSELLPTETPEERAARETAERLHLESLEEEKALVGGASGDGAAEDKVEKVLIAQAKVDSQGKRLGVALAAVAAVLIGLGGLVALAFQQGWFAHPATWFEGGNGEAGELGGLGQLDEDDSGDSRSIRKALWEIEKKRRAQAARRKRKRPGKMDLDLPDPSELGLGPKNLSEEEKRLQAFYRQQADEKRECAPRSSVEDLAKPVGIDMSTGVGGVLGLPGMQEGKAEVAPMAPEKMAPVARLTEDQINFVIRRHKMQIKKCLDHQLKRDAQVSGKMVVGVTVEPSGKVSGARIHTEKFRGTYLEECMLKKVRSWNFPRFKGDAYEIFFPLLLSARGGV